MKQTKEDKILNAARTVFLRYGYERSTMGDIAYTAQISRPALYLIYNSKEKVFKALFILLLEEMLTKIKAHIGEYITISKKIMYAFEIWSIKPFEMTQFSPNAKDLLENGTRITGDEYVKAVTQFEAILSEILEPHVSVQSKATLSTSAIAHIMTSAVLGFKVTATSAMQLRSMCEGLITLVLNFSHEE